MTTTNLQPSTRTDAFFWLCLTLIGIGVAVADLVVLGMAMLTGRPACRVSGS